MKLALTISHFFYPQYSNNQRAKILHHSYLGIIILVITLFQSFLYLASSPGAKILGYAANIAPSEVISLTNTKRTEKGLNTLQYSEALTQAATEKAQHMIDKDYWAHVAPDGTEPWEFFKNAGYKYRYAGENLARDFSNPNSAVEAWMNSPTHRDNLLSDRYTEIGVAVIEGDLNGVDTTIIVQLFGAKLTGVPAVPVASTETSAPTVNKIVMLPSVNEVIASSDAVTPSPRISPLSATKIFSLILVLILITALVIDGYIVTKKQLTRVAGRALAHVSFMGMVLAIILIIKAGQIL